MKVDIPYSSHTKDEIILLLSPDTCYLLAQLLKDAVLLQIRDRNLDMAKFTEELITDLEEEVFRQNPLLVTRERKDPCHIAYYIGNKNTGKTVNYE